MRRLSLIIVVVLIVLGAVFAYSKLHAKGSSDQTQYKVATVETGTVRKTVSATGTLQPWSSVDIKSKAGGRINALLVDVGSVVTKGQVIAKIDPTDTLLSVNTAQANIDSATARTRQAAQTYSLQVKQSQIAVNNAQASLQAAQANQQAAQARLIDAQSQAKAQPKQTAAAIAQAKASYTQAVKERASLDATNAQDRAAAKSAYDQAIANQKNAQASLTRQKSLVQKGYVAQQTVDTAQAAYDVAVAQTESAREKMNTLGAEQQAAIDAADARTAQAKAALQNAQAGSVDIATKRNAVIQAQAALAQANAQVVEAQVALNQAQADRANNGIKREDVAQAQATIAANRASLTNAKTTLQQTVVRSPSDGVVLSKAVSQGTYITSGQSLNSAGSTIVTIGDVTRMYVQATVDETDLAGVDEGQQVNVSFDAYPGISFDGKVARIEPQAVINQNVTQFNVRVEIDNSSPTFRLLKPGMNATCDFLVDQKENVLNVPSEAVQSDDNGSFVQIATGGHPAPADPALGIAADPDLLVGVKIKRQAVETGLEGNDSTEITSGLKAGDRVVTQTIAPISNTATTTTTTSSPFAGGGGGRGGGGRGR